MLFTVYKQLKNKQVTGFIALSDKKSLLWLTKKAKKQMYFYIWLFSEISEMTLLQDNNSLIEVNDSFTPYSL